MEPTPPEVLRLAQALEPLGVSVLETEIQRGTDEWSALPWTVRHAVESASERAHFAVADDEVDVLVYRSERDAEAEAGRIVRAFGDSPLARSASESLPTTYYVTGRTVIRHRGTDSTLTTRLATALGEPTYVAGDARQLVAGGLAPTVEPERLGCPPEGTSEIGSRYCIGPLLLSLQDRALTPQNYIIYYRAASLYEGENVPEWTVIPPRSAYSNPPPPSNL